MRKKPTFKQREFAAEFVKNGENGTQAALAVYDVSNVATAQVIASENLSKPIVIEQVQSLQDEIRQKARQYINKVDLVAKLVDSCLKALNDDDPKVQSMGRKDSAEVCKIFATEEKKTEAAKHLHLHTPKR